MTEVKTLEMRTLLTFNYGRGKEVALEYEGLLDFPEGEIINVNAFPGETNIPRGDYVVRRRGVTNQLTPHHDRNDTCYRYYWCDKI